MNWTQVYDPLGHWWLSTLVAALPIIVLFTLLAGLKVKPHWCAIAGAFTAVVVATLVFKMPATLATISFGLRRCFRHSENCLDCPRSCLFVRHLRRDRPVRNHEEQCVALLCAT